MPANLADRFDELRQLAARVELEGELGDMPNLTMGVMALASILGISDAAALDPSIDMADIISITGDGTVTLEDLEAIRANPSGA